MAASIRVTRVARQSLFFSRFLNNPSINKQKNISSGKNLTYRLFSTYDRAGAGGRFREFLGRSEVKLGIGISTCTFVLGSAVYSLCRSSRLPVVSASSRKPEFPISRKVRTNTDDTGLKITLFQYQSCPFCCKVRAFLDYHGFNYDVIEVNSVWQTQIKWSKYKKVPLVVIDGIGDDGYLVLRDSTVIISILKTFLVDRSRPLDKIVACYPSLESKNERGKKVLEFPNKYFIMFFDSTPAQTPEALKLERKWRKWTDEVMVHILSPNVYRTFSEALQAFNYFSEVGEWEQNFSTFERKTVIYVGAFVMYVLGKVLKKRHNLKDDVRQSLYDALDEWTNALGKNRPYMGGDRPDLGDLSAYGALSSIEGCNAFQDALTKTHIRDWYERMKKTVESHGGTEFMKTGK